MTEYVWGDLREKATAAFRETPGGQLEQRIIDVFLQHPQAVAALIETIKTKFDAGKVQSGWALLDYEAQRLTTLGNERATDSTDRNKAKRNVDQRIRAEFIHYDRPTEVHDELFGDRGSLRAWPEMADDIQQRWAEARPIGEQLEAEELERAARYKQSHPLGDPPPGRPDTEPSPEWGPPQPDLADIEIPF
jgi:hypothetical protein